MSLRELSALARRQVLPIVAVFLIVLGIAYSFKKTPPVFTESGDLVLVTSSAAPNPYISSSSTGSLISTGDVLVHWVNSSAGQAALQHAGAGAGFQIGLVNFSNEEYPYYSEPYLTVSGSGIEPTTASQVFEAGIKAFDQKLASIQAGVKANRAYLITTQLVGVSGPIIQPGSSKRVYAGLGVLGIIGAFLLAALLDKRRFRLGLLARRRGFA